MNYWTPSSSASVVCGTENFQMYKLGLEKAEEPEIKLPAFVGSWRKKRISEKTSTSASLTTRWQCGSQQTMENS